MKVNYINLTNGIESLPMLKLWNEEFRFIRIQSSICERKMWDRLIQDLDYDFLLNVAIGNECAIYDYGARKPVPRAAYQGIEFIKYVLHKRWLNEEYHTDCNRGKGEHIRKDCNSYFESCYRNLEDRTKKKLDYFKPYVVGKIDIVTVTDATVHDGDRDFYREILLREAV